MSKLTWDDTGKRLFETGVSKGVLYPQNSSGIYPLGVAWNGLTAVTESPSGAEAKPKYADNIKYLNLVSTEEFGAKIEAYTYPDEFYACDGSVQPSTGVAVSQQARKAFGLAYKTALGNDASGIDYGYKLHLVYGAMAAPSEKAFASINDAPDAITFSWAVTTTPVCISGYKPAASVVIDSTKVDSAKLAALETLLYGSAGVDPRLPLPDEVITLFASAAPLAIAMSTIVPADAATAVAVGAAIVITFNNKIANENVTLMTAAGVLVTEVDSWDAGHKILTMTPSVALTAATKYLVFIGNVTDIYGQTLANAVKSFTTA